MKVSMRSVQCFRSKPVHLNSLWSIWYCLIVIGIHVYLVYRFLYKLDALEASLKDNQSLSWSAGRLALYRALVSLSVLFVVPFTVCAIFKVGNFANDNEKLGKLIARVVPKAADPSMDGQPSRSVVERKPFYQRAWRHFLPVAGVFHVLLTWLLVLPDVLLKAAYLPYVAGVNGLNVWSSEVDILLNRTMGRSTLLLPINCSTMPALSDCNLVEAAQRTWLGGDSVQKPGLPSAEFLHFTCALLLCAIRYPAVFWFTSKSFSLLFAAQQLILFVELIFGFAAFDLLYRIQTNSANIVVRSQPSFVLTPAASFTLYLCGAMLLFFVSPLVFQYGYSRYFEFYRKCYRLSNDEQQQQQRQSTMTRSRLSNGHAMSTSTTPAAAASDHGSTRASAVSAVGSVASPQGGPSAEQDATGAATSSTGNDSNSTTGATGTSGANGNSSESVCNNYAVNVLAMALLVLIAALRVAVVFDLIALYRLSSERVALAAIICDCIFMLSWILLWFLLTLKQNWSFKIQLPAILQSASFGGALAGALPTISTQLPRGTSALSINLPSHYSTGMTNTTGYSFNEQTTDPSSIRQLARPSPSVSTNTLAETSTLNGMAFPQLYRYPPQQRHSRRRLSNDSMDLPLYQQMSVQYSMDSADSVDDSRSNSVVSAPPASSDFWRPASAVGGELQLLATRTQVVQNSLQPASSGSLSSSLSMGPISNSANGSAGGAGTSLYSQVGVRHTQMVTPHNSGRVTPLVLMPSATSTDGRSGGASFYEVRAPSMPKIREEPEHELMVNSSPDNTFKRAYRSDIRNRCNYYFNSPEHERDKRPATSSSALANGGSSAGAQKLSSSTSTLNSMASSVCTVIHRPAQDQLSSSDRLDAPLAAAESMSSPESADSGDPVSSANSSESTSRTHQRPDVVLNSVPAGRHRTAVSKLKSNGSIPNGGQPVRSANPTSLCSQV